MAGFGLHAYGVVPTSTLDILGDIGVMLWFTIGLKLNVSSLFKAEIWAGANEHMSVIKSLTTINSLFLTMLGLIYFVDLNLASAALIGFSVSFSSRVITIKILEEKGEMRSRNG